MSAEPPAGPDVAPVGTPAPGPPAPRLLNRWITVVTGAGLLALTAVALWPAASGLDALDRPEDSLERVVGRELDFRAAAGQAARWERRVYDLAFANDADMRADALQWYEELIVAGASSRASLNRIVLLAEGGPAEPVERALDAWAAGPAPSARLEGWARAAYGETPPGPAAIMAALTSVRRELPAGWFADRLAARLAERIGDVPAVAAAERAIQTRGTRALHGYRLILGGQLALLALGLGVLVPLVTRGRAGAVEVAGTASLPPPWPGQDGIGLFARGGFGLLGVAALSPLLPDTGGMRALLAIASMLPLLAYLARYGQRRGLSLAETFGLRPAPGGPGPLVRATLGLVAVSTLADLVIETAGSRLGLSPHWTDGFQEDLVWGSLGRVLSDSLDGIVVAPIAEELLFRGLLYGSLRLRLGPWPAALLSGAVFAGAHGYGVVGTASVLASGVLWALAYERTRSLLPGMLAHAVGNFLATVIVLVTLRF